jgi:hypothetical protein
MMQLVAIHDDANAFQLEVATVRKEVLVLEPNALNSTELRGQA